MSVQGRVHSCCDELCCHPILPPRSGADCFQRDRAQGQVSAQRQRWQLLHRLGASGESQSAARVTRRVAESTWSHTSATPGHTPQQKRCPSIWYLTFIPPTLSPLLPMRLTDKKMGAADVSHTRGRKRRRSRPLQPGMCWVLPCAPSFIAPRVSGASASKPIDWMTTKLETGKTVHAPRF